MSEQKPRSTLEKWAERSEAMKALVQSPALPRIKELLKRHESAVRNIELETLLPMLVIRALGGPRPHERLTKSERAQTARKIEKLAGELLTLLLTVHGDDENRTDWPFEFQSELDAMALHAALEFRAYWKGRGELGALLEDAEGDAFHVARSACYHLLREGMPAILETLEIGAEQWRTRGSQPLAKPNHKNARRLYFIRSLTAAFCSQFGTPARELTLLLASVYFDCSDLDEAGVSTIAPVSNRQNFSFR